ncbi:MAG: chemotaxis protein CheX [Spirochaetales bacterium]|nr:chemotaxis protein CheX [Spirochaetales bacterium]
MNIRYITPFIEATQNAFLELLGSKPEALTPFLVRREEVLDWDISGVIGIAGEARGVVVLSFPRGLAQEITTILTGQMKTSVDDDVIDTVGELVNIIAGNAKRGLEEFKLMISLPSIVQGDSHQIGWPSGSVPIVGIPFTTPQGHFNLSVGLENIITV